VFRAQVLDRLRRDVGFDWYAWVLTDPATEVGVDPLAHVPDLAVLPTVVRLKYLTAVNRWTTLDGVGRLRGDASDSPLWSQVQSRYGVADVVSVVFRDRFGCWGFLDLWSTRAYAADDLAFLRDLTPALTRALRLRQARTFEVVAAGPAGALSGPVVLLMDADLGIVGQTGASQEWLRILLPQPGGVAPIPACAFNVAAQLLARESGVDVHEPTARIHLADGFWVTLRASRVEPGDLIAVTIEPTTSAGRLDVFARANGLSPREKELVTLLAQGCDTSDAATRMCLSPHTVQDHLKTVFTKTGTHNRRVLLSHALGVRGQGDSLGLDPMT
jgi:DNA-binding CsgD family transcriptional regulator